MLLTIDRVLQLLSEGKTIDKISQMATCDDADVVSVIEEARELLNKHEKNASRKKIILKKKTSSEPKNAQSDEDDRKAREILSGAELSVIPVNASLVIYAGAESLGNPGNAGIGIVIVDSNDRQIGKVSDYIGVTTKLTADFMAVIRALKMASYFQVKDVRIRTDSEVLVKQVNGTMKMNNANLLRYYDKLKKLLAENSTAKIEYIAEHHNDKARFFALKGCEKGK